MWSLIVVQRSTFCTNWSSMKLCELPKSNKKCYGAPLICPFALTKSLGPNKYCEKEQSQVLKIPRNLPLMSLDMPLCSMLADTVNLYPWCDPSFAIWTWRKSFFNVIVGLVTMCFMLPNKCFSYLSDYDPSSKFVYIVVLSQLFFWMCLNISRRLSNDNVIWVFNFWISVLAECT